MLNCHNAKINVSKMDFLPYAKYIIISIILAFLLSGYQHQPLQSYCDLSLFRRETRVFLRHVFGCISSAPPLCGFV